MELIMLVHGFNVNSSDMLYLKENLSDLGYEVMTVDLPTSFSSLEECTIRFEHQFYEIKEKLIKQKGNKNEQAPKIHLVGHSMGGLIIRYFLSRNKVPNVGRVVLIATPNDGTKLADLLCLVAPPITKVYKPLLDLKTPGPKISEPMSCPSLEIGLIYGTANNIVFGALLDKNNDGRVEETSAKLQDQGITDIIALPFGHKEIHYRKETAQYVFNFVSSGNFNN